MLLFTHKYAAFKAAGVDLGRPLLVSCGAGVGSALLAFALSLLDIHVPVYDVSTLCSNQELSKNFTCNVSVFGNGHHIYRHFVQLFFSLVIRRYSFVQEGECLYLTSNSNVCICSNL